MQIDHLIYAARDLDAAAGRLEVQLGVPIVGGGRHDGLGTHNRIMPLGGGYLEILSVADPEQAARSEMGAAISERINQSADGLAGWAVAVADVGPVAARLGTAITTISRQGLSARLTGVAEAMREPFLPFFISRDPGIADPGVQGDAGGITWVEVAGDADRLDRWLGNADLPVRVIEGDPAVRAAGIGSLEFRPPAA